MMFWDTFSAFGPESFVQAPEVVRQIGNVVLIHLLFLALFIRIGEKGSMLQNTRHF